MFMLIAIEKLQLFWIASIVKLKLILSTLVLEGTIAIALGTSPQMVVDAKKNWPNHYQPFMPISNHHYQPLFPEQSTEPVRDFLSKYKIWAGFASPPTWGESQRSKPQPYIYSARYGGIAQCCVFQRLAGVYLCEWWCVLSWIHFSQLYWNIFS